MRLTPSLAIGFASDPSAYASNPSVGRWASWPSSQRPASPSFSSCCCSSPSPSASSHGLVSWYSCSPLQCQCAAVRSRRTNVASSPPPIAHSAPACYSSPGIIHWQRSQLAVGRSTVYRDPVMKRRRVKMTYSTFVNGDLAVLRRLDVLGSRVRL